MAEAMGCDAWYVENPVGALSRWWRIHYLISDSVVRRRWEVWTVKIEGSGPIGELPPQTMIDDDPKPLEANGGARGITYFRI